MSAALAFVAAVGAVLGLRDLGAGALSAVLAALASRGPAWLRVVTGLAQTVIRAGREGRDPGALERRRLLSGGSAVAFAGGAVTFGPVAGLALAAAGPFGVGRILAARRRRYRAAVDAGVPEMAVAIADALSGGCSLRSALAESARGLGGAAGHELRRTAAELATGAPTDDALEAMRRRARSPGMDTLVAACLLQRRAGGDLARLLRDSARALEDQARLEDEVRAATAQARFTGLIVVVLPLGGALLTELASPGWFAGLWSTFLTAWLVGIALALQIVAAVLMNRMARVRW
jgi:tight adherence protein B